jgi:hypothetical protein
MTHISPIHGYVANTLHGAFLESYMRRIALDPADLLKSDQLQALAVEVTDVLRATLGISWDELAYYALMSICQLMSDESVLNTSLDNIAMSLWLSLGDPERGGPTPPQAYKDAASSVYTIFLLMLNPKGFPTSTP